MSTAPVRVLLVAQRTAATAALGDAVRERAERDTCAFTLLVPRPYVPRPTWDTDPEDAELTLHLALPVLDRAAGSHVEGVVGPTDPLQAVRELHEQEPFDEVIVSTLPTHVSKWLHLDLPHRIARELGLPVQVVTAPHERHDDHAVHGTIPDHL